MLARITDVTPLGHYLLRLKFTDGVESEVDFRQLVVGRVGVLAAIEDERFFMSVKVDREIGTLVWPNGVDFDPDVIRAMATRSAPPLGTEASLA